MTVITSIRVRRPERRHSPPRHLRRLPLTADQIADRDDDYMSIAAYWRQRREEQEAADTEDRRYAQSALGKLHREQIASGFISRGLD